MNVLLFTGTEEINNFIKNNYTDLCVFICLNKSELVSNIKKHDIDRIVITSKALDPNDDSNKQILLKIQKETRANIVFFYGDVKEPVERDAFRNFLFSKGIYNYHDGANVRVEDITFFLYNNKTVDDWREFISDEFSNQSVISDETITPSVKERVVEKVVVKKVDNFVAVKQLVVGLFGEKGKTVNGLHMAALMSEQYNLKTCFVDLNLTNPSISFLMKSKDPSFYQAFKDETDYGYSPFKDYPNLHLINGVYNEAFNFNQPFGDKLTASDVHEIINMLKNQYDLIFIDTSGDFYSPINQYIYRQTNKRICFTRQNYASLKSLKITMNNAFLNDPETCYFVLNEHKKLVLSEGEFKDVLKVKYVFPISYYAQMDESLINSKLYMNDNYKKQLLAIVDELTNLPQMNREKKKLFNLFKRRK